MQFLKQPHMYSSFFPVFHLCYKISGCKLLVHNLLCYHDRKVSLTVVKKEKSNNLKRVVGRGAFTYQIKSSRHFLIFQNVSTITCPWVVASLEVSTIQEKYSQLLLKGDVPIKVKMLVCFIHSGSLLILTMNSKMVIFHVPKAKDPFQQHNAKEHLASKC